MKRAEETAGVELEAALDDIVVAEDDAAAADALLALVAEAAEEREVRETARPARIDGVVVGRLIAVDEAGPVVVHRHAACALGDRARAFTALASADAGREVAIVFEDGAPDRPIVIGKMHEAAKSVADPGERLVLRADREIVLACGDASIVLTRAGKILIKGAYVSSRASSVNRIQGGSVEIN